MYVDPNPYVNYGGGYINGQTWYTTSGTAVTYPVIAVTNGAAAASDWDRAALKAEPDDEFTWLRKRVNEMTDKAFA